MQRICVLLFAISTIPLSGQYTSTKVEDFNKDGVEDRLNCSYEIGNSFGGGDCSITDGKTKNTFNLNTYASFNRIKKRVYVATALREKENEYFLYTLKKEMLPIFRATPDQSLLWIIYAGLHTNQLRESTYFDLRFNPKMAWRYEEPELPSTYFIEMNAATLSKIVKEETNALVKKNHTNKKDYLMYFGDSHSDATSESLSGFNSVAKNQSYEIFKTKHGVLVKKGATYKWLFVTDIDINDAPEKMRWASIEDVILHDKYVIFKQNVIPRDLVHIYIINIESGIGGRLKLDHDKQSYSKTDLIIIKDNSIQIGSTTKKKRFPLTEIKEALDKGLK